MNLDSLSFALSQINYLTVNLNKKNFKSSQAEITLVLSLFHTYLHISINIPFFHLFVENILSFSLFLTQLIENNGFEAERHLFRCLVSTIDFNTDTKSSAKDFHQIQLFKEYFLDYLYRPCFASILCYSIENPLQFQEVCSCSNLCCSYHLITHCDGVGGFSRKSSLQIW